MIWFINVLKFFLILFKLKLIFLIGVWIDFNLFILNVNLFFLNLDIVVVILGVIVLDLGLGIKFFVFNILFNFLILGIIFGVVIIKLKFN